MQPAAKVRLAKRLPAPPRISSGLNSGVIRKLGASVLAIFGVLLSASVLPVMK